MICEAVMPRYFAENVNFVKQDFAASVIDSLSYSVKPDPVLDTRELLALLEARGIKNREIAKALGVNDSRVTEIKKGQRQVKLDEAATLVRTFGLEQNRLEPLHPRMSRLLVQYVAAALGKKLDPETPESREVIATVEAFSRFVADPQVRGSVEAADNFFRAMMLRSQVGSEDQPETDPANTH
jgi:predicted XRE-type DNA-binding protein